jgi:hypothetical protein
MDYDNNSQIKPGLKKYDAEGGGHGRRARAAGTGGGHVPADISRAGSLKKTTARPRQSGQAAAVVAVEIAGVITGALTETQTNLARISADT